MHILIVGNYTTDRAGFIDRLLAGLDPQLKLYGYRSVKEEEDKQENAPIYIYPVKGKRKRSDDNLLGCCKSQYATVYPEAFERNAYLIEDAKPDGLLVMDEIGPMESRSPRFCAAVLAALDGDVPILASVRDNDTPFLNEVRSHPNAQCFYLTKENGETLFPEVLAFLQEQYRAE